MTVKYNTSIIMMGGGTVTPITLNDTDTVLSWRNHPSVVENFIYRKPITKQEHEAWFANKVQKGIVAQFIIRGESGAPLGCVYLQNIDYENRKAEEGIFLSPDCPRGKGIGKSAVGLVLKYGFEELKLHKVTARVLLYNSASLRLHEKVGFSREGVFRDELLLDGKFEDVVFFGMLENEFGGCK